MLITALVEHGTTRNLPPRFYRQRGIRWAILLDATGQCTTGQLEDLADATMPHGPQLPTPYVYRSGKHPAPMLAADTLHYVAAIPKHRSEKAIQDAKLRNENYIELLREWHSSAPDDQVAAAVLTFFEHGGHRKVSIPETAGPADVAAIRVNDHWAHLVPSATAFWEKTVRKRKTSASSAMAVCLACGQEGVTFESLPEPIKAGAIPAASGRARDAQLVSINAPAHGRGGKLQLAATPICESCGAQAMAALNALLADDQHRRRSNNSVLTWWLRKPEPLPFMRMLDNPDPAQISELYKSVHKTTAAAIIPLIDENRFYALTLGANQSRVVVRDWIDIPVPTLKAHLTAWFDNHRIADIWQDGPQLVPLWQLARATARWNASTSRYMPGSEYYGIEHELLRCALHAAPPPASLLPYLLHRIRADNRLDLPRAALLRLIMTRPPYKEHILTDLDEASADPAYVWGRIFAVLEAIQRRALPDLSATIRDRYFRIAMTQPLTVYPALRAGANAHLSKLQRNKTDKAAVAAGRALENRLTELATRLYRQPPSQLDAPGQARFAIGYDHQRAADMAAARAHSQLSQPTTTNQETQQ
jgi:CRISPR-associated protein Csd1